MRIRQPNTIQMCPRENEDVGSGENHPQEGGERVTHAEKEGGNFNRGVFSQAAVES